METLLAHIDSDTAHALAWTIIHSSWQASMVGLILYTANSQLKKASHRYHMTILAQASILLMSIVTYCYYTIGIAETATETGLWLITDKTTTALIGASTYGPDAVSLLDKYSPFVLAVWLGGMTIFLIKLLVALLLVSDIKKGTEVRLLTTTLAKLTKQLQVQRTVKILASTAVAVPQLVGHMKPVILFPIGLINALTIEEIEGIMAHELAHVIRHDYLANILQTVLEAIYYYHPVVWWISASARIEREHCCDDIALRSGVSPMIYTKTLVKLQELNIASSPSLAMSVADNQYQLLNRIKRILNMNQSKRNSKEKSIATMTMLVMALLFSSHLLTGNTAVISDEVSSITPDIEQLRTSPYDELSRYYAPTIDTLPRAKSRISIQTDRNGKSMSMTKENGKITDLKIDGKTIDPSEYHLYEDDTDDVIIMGDDDSRMMFFNGNGGSLDSLFGSGRMNFDLNFDNLFDGQGMEEMLQRFEGMQNHFVMPDMEHLEDMLENLGGTMEEMRWDTIFENAPHEQMRFFFDQDNEEFDVDSDRRWTTKSRGKVADILGAELNKDGLLEPFKQNQVELTGKHLKINGEKQPSNIWGKYKRLYEDRTGMMMSKRSRIDFSVEGIKSDRKIRTF